MVSRKRQRGTAPKTATTLTTTGIETPIASETVRAIGRTRDIDWRTRVDARIENAQGTPYHPEQ